MLKREDIEMDPDQIQNRLTGRERFKVAAVAIGFLFVLGFLAYLAIAYVGPGTLLRAIGDSINAGKIRRALAICLGLGFYLVGLPAALAIFLLAAFQGAVGKKTWLTRWVLRALSQEVHKRHDE